MKPWYRYIARAVLIVVLRTLGSAQNEIPELLRNGAHCLESKKFLPETKEKTLLAGYMVDAKSYPGDKVLYIVVYTLPDRSRGLAFSIFLGGPTNRTVFNIQNNAEFVRASGADADFKKERVRFIGDPLGGIWTQEHIAAAINHIGQEPIFDLRLANSSPELSGDQCKSYVDTFVKRY